MKPGHILVFDGLRMTTEHIEHMQGALHSGLQDVRKILGLAKVQDGLQVLVDGQNVVIQPGLAFDAHGNRIVCDEPLRLAVEPSNQATPAFVALAYDQVESGNVEGHPTLIWDSCKAALLAEPPPKDSEWLLLAHLGRSAQGGLVIEQDPSPPAPAEDSATQAGNGTPPGDSPAPQPPGLPGAPPALAISQGVLRQLPEAQSDLLQRAWDAWSSSPDGQRQYPLKEMAIPAGFHAQSLTMVGSIAVEGFVNGQRLQASATFQSEAAPTGQFALIHRLASQGEFVEGSLASLPFQFDSPGLDESFLNFLAGHSLRLEMSRWGDNDLVVRASLAGPGSEEGDIRTLFQSNPVQLTWQFSLGWKALGYPGRTA